MPPSLRTEAVRACVRAVAALDGPPASAVLVSVTCGGLRVEATVSPEEAAAILGPPPAAPLLPLERALLAALTAEEQAPKAVARKAGKNLGAHVYAALRSLVRKGAVVRGPRGDYRLP